MDIRLFVCRREPQGKDRLYVSHFFPVIQSIPSSGEGPVTVTVMVMLMVLIDI